jgi:hypothetical protein
MSPDRGLWQRGVAMRFPACRPAAAASSASRLAFRLPLRRYQPGGRARVSLAAYDCGRTYGACLRRYGGQVSAIRYRVPTPGSQARARDRSKGLPDGANFQEKQ